MSPDLKEFSVPLLFYYDNPLTVEIFNFMKMTLRSFYYLSLIILSALMAVIIAELHSSARHQSALVENMLDSIQSVDAANNLGMNLSLHRRQSLLKGLRPLENRRAERNQARLNLEQGPLELLKLADTASERDLVKLVQAHIEKYLQKFDSNFRQGLREDSLYASVANEYETAQEAIHHFVDSNVQQSHSFEASFLERVKFDYRISLLIGILSLLLIPVMGFGFRRLILNPLLLLKKQLLGYDSHQLRKDLKVTLPEKAAFEIQEITSAFQDLTSRLAEQRERQLTYLAAIAHDLRNPLGAIQMSIELLLEEPDLSPTGNQTVGIISRQTGYLNRLVEDFLDRSQIEAGKLNLKLEAVNLIDTIEDSVRLYQNLAPQHQIQIEKDLDRVLISADSLRVSQVFNNLISNAIKYSPKGGRITIQIRTESNQVIVRVCDSGVGISPEEVSSIFKPFNRSKLARETVPGIGLGLSTSKKIIEAHQGSISVESKPGHGTRFIVTFPLTLEQDHFNPNQLSQPVI
jgi:two-component system sensor histidine kinase MtrB